jgi:hypothetical protein
MRDALTGAPPEIALKVRSHPAERRRKQRPPTVTGMAMTPNVFKHKPDPLADFVNCYHGYI